MSSNVEFAITDVETTGLFPKRGDRVVEIAVIRTNINGKIVDEYTTLVHPERDIGPTHIHGVTTKDIIGAPRFEEIAGDVVALLAGAIFVAHNVHFDKHFIQSEFERIGYVLPEFPHLCTMQLARKTDPDIPSRNLADLCTHFGILLDHAHSAYSDAQATARLLTECIQRVAPSGRGRLNCIGISGKRIGKERWPSIIRSNKSHTREEALREDSLKTSYVARLVAKLPTGEYTTPEVEDYLSLLDKVLEDRRVTKEEASQLFLLASDAGLTREQVVEAHREYMRDLMRVAVEDDVLSEAEERDLDEVRNLLSISKEEYEKLLSEVMREKMRGATRAKKLVTESDDLEGKSICFTGTSNCRINNVPIARSFAEKMAMEKGMLVKKNVTKKLDFLVIADPDSLSGKAKKARQYGIRIVAEPVFWRMVGIDVE